jgi:hypothetical protein
MTAPSDGSAPVFRTPVFIVERVGFAGTRRVECTMSVVRGEDDEVHVHLRS